MKQILINFILLTLFICNISQAQMGEAVGFGYRGALSVQLAETHPYVAIGPAHSGYIGFWWGGIEFTNNLKIRAEIYAYDEEGFEIGWGYQDLLTTIPAEAGESHEYIYLWATTNPLGAIFETCSVKPTSYDVKLEIFDTSINTSIAESTWQREWPVPANCCGIYDAESPFSLWNTMYAGSPPASTPSLIFQQWMNYDPATHDLYVKVTDSGNNTDYVLGTQASSNTLNSATIEIGLLLCPNIWAAGQSCVGWVAPAEFNIQLVLTPKNQPPTNAVYQSNTVTIDTLLDVPMAP